MPIDPACLLILLTLLIYSSQGKAVWSLEGENISSLAACESRGEVALGRQDGSVQLWETGDWSPRATFHTSSTGNVTALQYGSIAARRDSKLPKTFLIVSQSPVITHLSPLSPHTHRHAHHIHMYTQGVLHVYTCTCFNEK